MNDYVGLGCLVILLIISLIIAKKDYKNWYDSNGINKSFIIRAIVFICFGITLIILKIIKS